MKSFKTLPLRSVSESGNGADTDDKRTRVAKHALINAAGQEVDDEESATGIRYRHKNSTANFDLQVSTMPEAGKNMLANFGAKTLAGHVASQVKTSQGDDADPYDAIVARFEGIAGGTWLLAGGAGGPNLDALAQAVVNVGAKASPPQVVQLTVVRDKLEADEAFRKMVQKVPAVASEYAALRGGQVKTVSDIFSAIGQ